jgi:hypothetical protein
MQITTDAVVTIITGVLQTGGIATFLYFLFRGLRQQIATLNTTVEQQRKTLDVMERRIEETEKFGEMYRRMLSDLPADMDKFKQVISHVKDATIAELEKANQSKDEKLKGLTELELKKIEITEKAIQELPALREELVATMSAIHQRVETAFQYVPERRLRTESWLDSYWQALAESHNLRRGRVANNRRAALYINNYDDVLEGAFEMIRDGRIAATPSTAASTTPREISATSDNSKREDAALEEVTDKDLPQDSAAETNEA